MKSTGITRKIDELGRIVLPIELRRSLDISERDALEIFVDGENIVPRKNKASCVFCNSADNVIGFKDKFICPECYAQLKKN